MNFSRQGLRVTDCGVCFFFFACRLLSAQTACVSDSGWVILGNGVGVRAIELAVVL